MSEDTYDNGDCAYCGDKIVDSPVVTPGTDKEFCSVDCCLDYSNESLEVVDGEYVENE